MHDEREFHCAREKEEGDKEVGKRKRKRKRRVVERERTSSRNKDFML